MWHNRCLLSLKEQPSISFLRLFFTRFLTHALFSLTHALFSLTRALFSFDLFRSLSLSFSDMSFPKPSLSLSLSVKNNSFYFFSAFFSLVFVNTKRKGQLAFKSGRRNRHKVSLRFLSLSLSLSLSSRVVNFRSSSPGGREGGKNTNNNNGSSSSRAQIEPLGNGRREICPAILSHRGEVTNGTNLSRGGRRRRRVTREK